MVMLVGRSNPGCALVPTRSNPMLAKASWFSVSSMRASNSSDASPLARASRFRLGEQQTPDALPLAIR